MFDALVLRSDNNGFLSGVEQLEEKDLDISAPIMVHVSHSGINYKDALAVLNKGKIVRAPFPFVPGIDLVGEVCQSSDPRFGVGDWIIGTGGGLGEVTWGGYSAKQRVPSEFLIGLPSGMSPFVAMGIGTAGVTAALSVMKLQDHGRPKDEGQIVVTGASGGVGSFATLLLSRAGYSVAASTGKRDAHKYLQSLGASSIIERDELSAGASRPLDTGRWAGAVDSVGGKSLEAVISQVKRHGCIAACGNASGADVNTSVYPFILRGVTLCGIDSNTATVPQRTRAWQLLSEYVTDADIENMATTVRLPDVHAACERLMAGQSKGRFVVEL